MIRYTLRCGSGHQFDDWFSTMADFDRRRPELVCPECGSSSVDKAIQAPHVGKARATEPAPPPCGAPACAGGRCAMAGFD